MKLLRPQTPYPARGASRWLWFIAGCCVLTLVLIVLGPRARQTASKPPGPEHPSSASPGAGTPPSGESPTVRSRAGSPPFLPRTAAETVAEKVILFVHGRREIVRGMARRLKVEVPAEVERFFDAVEAGRLDEANTLFKSMSALRDSADGSPTLKALWPAILETQGVADVAHEWPAQQLLDYGNAVLGSLRPDMVYLGGTDDGRFIPTLLNETGEGKGHMILTQNCLSDPAYLDYLSFLYGDRLNNLTSDDVQKARDAYLADAQKRLQHDQQYPDESPQLRPGENVANIDGNPTVSGKVADMGVLDLLLNALLQKNPGLSFALQESFPMKSTYAGAAPLGPITELGIQTGQDVLTPDAAGQSLDYWRSTAQALLANPDAAASSSVRNAYTKLILGQANLFLDRNLTAEAAQAYQLATTLSPSDPAAVFSYINLLLKQQRYNEARQIAQTAANLAPDNIQFGAVLDRLNRIK